MIFLKNFVPFKVCICFFPNFCSLLSNTASDQIFSLKTTFMEFNLIDSVKSLFNHELVSKSASFLGESETGIQKALSAAIPTALTGLLSKASSTTGGVLSVLDLAKQNAGSGLLHNVSGLFSGGGLSSGIMGTMSHLFGDKMSGITQLISRFSGVKESSASSILGMASAASMDVLGQHVNQSNLSSSGLLSFLNNQKDSILNSVPSGFNLAGALGLGSLASIGSKLSEMAHSIGGAAKHTVAYAEGAARKASSGLRWVLPLLLLLLVGFAIWFFTRGSKKSNQQTANVDTMAQTTMAPDTTAAVMPAARESLKVKLPDGTELDAYKGGIEDQLVAFLMTDYKKLGADSLKKIWFDFDDLNFKTGSAEITPESQHQIDNIAAILKAFPKSKIKIGGYTDKTGNEPANMQLSSNRAMAARQALTKAGVGAQVTGAEGYGSQFAKVPADAPESDRLKDRRVSVSVRG
jgi:outer membrane protein OmpA-like peptidoglycan-associated protein